MGLFSDKHNNRDRQMIDLRGDSISGKSPAMAKLGGSPARCLGLNWSLSARVLISAYPGHRKRAFSYST